MTFENALSHGKELLKSAGVVDYELDAWYLLEYVCKMDRSSYYLHSPEEMKEEEFQEYESLLKKRGERVPLQYITGVQGFMGLEFKVNSHVLIPRQDTETLVEEALKVLEPGMEVLDMCTGSGCVMVSLLKHSKHDISGTASDVSKQALLIAKENAKNNQVEMELVRSDLFQNISGTFDMILANPPYIPTNKIETLMPEVKNFEPVEALDGAEDGLAFYRRIVKEGKDFLKSNGYLYFEIGYDQGGRVAFLMEEHGFRNVKVIKDLTGNDRVVCGNLPSVI
ncbi:MAG: peptide chain release factor N(5)-glutamine methyltransferase [Lachnospiraceae bacterium]|nr:peptide chain release factor N(5)-glutamine methyltransferase [Lachnospiraceae bacterium]